MSNLIENVDNITQLVESEQVVNKQTEQTEVSGAIQTIDDDDEKTDSEDFLFNISTSDEDEVEVLPINTSINPVQSTVQSVDALAYLPCAAHNLQLAIKDALNSIFKRVYYMLY